MASTQQTMEFDRTLHHVNEALDVLTDTLRGVEGCEYPRLLAREIQALIIACNAHEKVRQATAGARCAETLHSPPRAAEVIRMMGRTLEAREAEISNLRDLLHHGVDTIEAHTLTDPEGTAVMHGDYQCINAIEIERWRDQAEAALSPARRSTERDRPQIGELRAKLELVADKHEPDSHGYCLKCGVRLAAIDNPNEPCRPPNA
jgi:hypothetical protein